MFFWWRSKKKAPARKRPPHRLRLESLERRELLTTVTNLSDSGAGSLRAAIASGGSIDFQAGLNGTILLSSPLNISNNVSIDAGTNTISIDGQNNVGVINTSGATTVSLTHLNIIDGSAGEGGGVYNGNGCTLSVTHCNFTGNQATNSSWGGGGLANFGALSVDGCTFEGNSATKGGGIWSAAAATGATIQNSTFHNNTATNGAAIQDESFSITLQAFNDTVQGNTDTGSDTGVIQVTPSSTAVLTNCTIVGNSSGSGTSGGVDTVGGTVKYINSIVADNSGSQFVASGGGTLLSLGHNIASDGTGNLTATGDLPNTEPSLGPLQNNGGITDTMAPTSASPAIGAGDNTAANLPADDQRGLPRILNGTVDIGAVERPVVDTTADNNDGNYAAGQLSLREAIGLVPAGATLLLDPSIAGDTIDLSAGGGGMGSTLDLTKNITIDASGLAGGLTISGGNSVAVINIDNTANVMLKGLTIADGNGGGSDGGGIINDGTLALSGCTLSGNVAADGGGIYNDGTLTVDRSTFSNNQAEQISGLGGALWSDGFSVATVTNSTFTGNTSAYGAAVEYYPITPGQFNNDTFVGNTDTGDETGIVEANTAAEIDLTNCTIANNTSGGPTAGAVSAYGGTVQFVNTIVAGNTVAQFISTFGGINGLLISLGHNISSDGTGNLTAAGDMPNTDPLLAPLANYGGSTSTAALLPGSPAINAGDDDAAPAQDQRGIARAGRSDIGAFESRGFTMTIAGGNNQAVAVGDAFAPLSVTVASGFGEPVQNGHVTFTPPATGASASFNSGRIATLDGAGSANDTPQANSIAGAYSISAATSGVATPVAFDLTNHGAASLEWSQRPSDVKSGAVMSPGVEVRILDENGQPFSSNATITLSASGPGSFTSGSTTSAAAVNGLATFDNLALDAAGTYTLTASMNNVPNLVSPQFNVGANHLAFISGPSVAFGGGISATVAAEDMLGNVDTGFQGGVEISLAAPATASLTGTSVHAATNGIAAFTGLAPTATQRGAVLVASAAGLSPASSAGVNLVVVSPLVPIAVPGSIYGPGPSANANTAEVRGLYHSVLGRDADTPGLQYWASQLGAGASPAAVAQALWLSTEHRIEEIDQDYLTLLQRPADALGRAAWLNVLETTQSETMVSVGMMSSGEYMQLHPGASAWVNAVYGDSLGRGAGSPEVNFWTSELASGASAGFVAEAIVSSVESLLRVVDSFYAAMLNRDIDAAGASFWVQSIAANQHGVGQAATDILGSAEYQTAARNSVS